jgi:hypothetical protein
VKVKFRIPSKTVQYGYAEVEYESGVDAHSLGSNYRAMVDAFQQGEVERRETVKLAQVLPLPQYDEPTPEEAEALIKSELGATSIDDIMNEDVEEEQAPYSAPVTPPSDDDWDF